jgi:hypothetical protein
VCAALPFVVQIRRKDERDEWQPCAAFKLEPRARSYAAPLLTLNKHPTYPWMYRVIDQTTVVAD